MTFFETMGGGGETGGGGGTGTGGGGSDSGGTSTGGETGSTGTDGEGTTNSFEGSETSNSSGDESSGDVAAGGKWPNDGDIDVGEEGDLDLAEDDYQIEEVEVIEGDDLIEEGDDFKQDDDSQDESDENEDEDDEDDEDEDSDEDDSTDSTDREDPESRWQRRFDSLYGFTFGVYLLSSAMVQITELKIDSLRQELTEIQLMHPTTGPGEGSYMFAVSPREVEVEMELKRLEDLDEQGKKGTDSAHDALEKMNESEAEVAERRRRNRK